MEEVTSIIKDSQLKKYEKLAKILKYLFVDLADIKQDSYYILGSFSIRKHRTISDLDINLDIDEFLKLSNLDRHVPGRLQFYNNQIRWFLDLTNEYNELTGENEKDFSIEAFQKNPSDGFPDSKFSLAYLRDENGFDRDEYGHQFFNLHTLLKWKKQMNRPKDASDIILIKKLLDTMHKDTRSTEDIPTDTTDTPDMLRGGSNIFKRKYLKYKTKYMGYCV